MLSSLEKKSNCQNELPFSLEPNDIQSLNCFQDERFNNIEIDWENQGGITIDKLASQFKL